MLCEARLFLVRHCCHERLWRKMSRKRKQLQDLTFIPSHERVKQKDVLHHAEISTTDDGISGIAAAMEKWKPLQWESQWNNIKAMRSAANAAVDSMGADSCADIAADVVTKRYQTLLSLMLSAQTKDEITYAAMERLKVHGCTVDNIAATDESRIGELIYPVSFWKRKANFIKRTTDILKAQYNGDVPQTVHELCALPGVGPKMAHLCMNIAWNKSTGIAVDTHVHRICNRLGWVRKETKFPEETRKAIEDWMPQEMWLDVNKILVGFGQQTCGAIKPKCGECLNRAICPFGMKMKQ